MLGAAAYNSLHRKLEPVTLAANDVLYTPGEAVKYIYFPNDAIVSLLFTVDRRRTVEVAMEGNEGAVGVAVWLGGVNSQNLSVVREAGTATRLATGVLLSYATPRNALGKLLCRYTHALITQIAQLSLCNRFHPIDARLARWLLMNQDRSGRIELRATHQLIAEMLGVRRSSITAAAASFHRRDLISYRRGRIEVKSQSLLLAASCPCYRLIKDRYDSFLGA
jgi:CRP-like cAMP-binding protein